MNQPTHVPIDVCLSAQWRIHGGPVKRAAREELRDRFLPLVIQAFGSVESCLNLLLKESVYSNGYQIRRLLKACELFCVRCYREAVDLNDRARAAEASKFAERFRALSEMEHKFCGEAISENDLIRALLRSDVCQLPPPQTAISGAGTTTSRCIGNIGIETDIRSTRVSSFTEMGSAVSAEISDFNSEEQRLAALADYTGEWNCSEAALARAACVNPSDLSKWKKGLLPRQSSKRQRLEKALTNHVTPVAPAFKPGQRDWN